MCLFLAMSGTPVNTTRGARLQPLLSQTRPSTGAAMHVRHGNRTNLYDLTPLHGWRDEFDGALYEAAVAIFQDNLREHADACRQ